MTRDGHVVLGDMLGLRNAKNTPYVIDAPPSWTSNRAGLESGIRSFRATDTLASWTINTVLAELGDAFPTTLGETLQRDLSQPRTGAPKMHPRAWIYDEKSPTVYSAYAFLRPAIYDMVRS